MNPSSMKGDFCGIDDFKPSSETLEAIAQMNRIVKITDILHNTLIGTPFFQIFAGRSTYTWASISVQGYQVYATDWDVLRQSLGAVKSIRRERLETIATGQALFAKGKDEIFWRCMVNAL